MLGPLPGALAWKHPNLYWVDLIVLVQTCEPTCSVNPLIHSISTLMSLTELRLATQCCIRAALGELLMID